MSLQRKLFLILILSWFIGTICITVISYRIILRDYKIMENEEVVTDYERLNEAISRLKESLNLLTVDWAHWNDSYQFLQDKNQRYIDENIKNQTTFKDTKINFMLYFDANENYFIGNYFSHSKSTFLEVPQTLIKALIKNKKYFLKNDEIEQNVAGFVKIPEGIVLLSSYPITNSDSTKKPNGNILMGYFFDDLHLKALIDLVRFKIKLYPYPLNSITPNVDMPKKIFVEKQFYYTKDDDYIYLYTNLSDIQGTHIALLQMDIPRLTYNKGLKTIYIYLFIIAIFSLFTILFVIALLRKYIVNRIQSYENQLNEITTTKNFGSQIKMSGKDEIKRMVDSSNNMLDIIQIMRKELNDTIDRLTATNINLNEEITERNKAEKEVAALNHKLVIAARRAGMADIITSVLHNIGNVLNSIKTSVSLLDEHTSNNIDEHFHKIAELIATHEKDLAAFLSQDPKGKKIQPLLSLLANKLTENKRFIIQEISELKKNIDHVTNIISMEQTMSRRISLIEEISVKDLIQNALSICKTHFGESQVEIIQEIQDIPPVMIDHINLLQIIVNLIKNAIESVKESDNQSKRIIIRVKTVDDLNFIIQISDNGLGIKSENLLKIFNSGFTTKKNGRGFGLHTSSLAAQDMGGSLTVESEGIGKGATFTLTLPYKPPVRGE